MLSVQDSLQDVTLQAVVDTAAAVTIISDSIFRELEPKFEEMYSLYSRTRHEIGGFCCRSSGPKADGNTFPEAIYVAPIQDGMLLGLDFMLRHGADI